MQLFEEAGAYTYVKFQDLKQLELLRGQTVFAIRAQPGTKLEVPDPYNDGVQKRYQMYLTSQWPIDVYLVCQPSPPVAPSPLQTAEPPQPPEPISPLGEEADWIGEPPQHFFEEQLE